MAKFTTEDIINFSSFEEVRDFALRLQRELAFVLQHLEKDNFTASFSDDILGSIKSKQGLIVNAANRLFYGSGKAGVLNQLAQPPTAGAVLQQDTSGAPYWTQTPTLLNDFYIASTSTSQTVNTTMKALTLGADWVTNNAHGLFVRQADGIKVAKSGLYKIRVWMRFGDSVNSTVMPGKNGTFYNFPQLFTGIQCVAAEFHLDGAAGDVFSAGISTSQSTTIGAGIFGYQLFIQPLALY